MALVAVYVRSASINIIRSYRMQMNMNLSDAGHLLSLLVLIADGRLCGVFFFIRFFFIHVRPARLARNRALR